MHSIYISIFNTLIYIYIYIYVYYIAELDEIAKESEEPNKSKFKFNAEFYFSKFMHSRDEHHIKKEIIGLKVFHYFFIKVILIYIHTYIYIYIYKYIYI